MCTVVILTLLRGVNFCFIMHKEKCSSNEKHIVHKSKLINHYSKGIEQV